MNEFKGQEKRVGVGRRQIDKERAALPGAVLTSAERRGLGKTLGSTPQGSVEREKAIDIQALEAILPAVMNAFKSLPTGRSIPYTKSEFEFGDKYKPFKDAIDKLASSGLKAVFLTSDRKQAEVSWQFLVFQPPTNLNIGWAFPYVTMTFESGAVPALFKTKSRDVQRGDHITDVLRPAMMKRFADGESWILYDGDASKGEVK